MSSPREALRRRCSGHPHDSTQRICVTHGELKLLRDFTENDDGTRTYEPYYRLMAGSMLGACAVHLYLTPSDAAKAADVLHLTVEDMT